MLNVIEVSSVDRNEVGSYLNNKEQLLIEKATTEDQPPNTYILGILKSNGKTKSQLFNIVLELEEVGNAGSKLLKVELCDASLKHFDTINALFNNEELWMAFENFQIDLSALNLIIRYPIGLEDKNDAIVYAFVKYGKCTDYNILTDLYAKNHINVLCVASGDMKPLSSTRNGNRHTIVGVIDNSLVKNVSPDVTLEQFDIPVHVFLNVQGENLPFEAIKKGDIMRLALLQRNQDKKTGKDFGLIQDTKSITIYRKINGTLRYETGCSSYIFTKKDQRLVADLFIWMQSLEQLTDDSMICTLSIDEIKEPGYFHLRCKVVNIKELPDQSHILTVTDGTPVQVSCSKVHNDRTGKRNSRSIDIRLIQRLNETLSEIVVGDYVELCHVLCEEISSKYYFKMFHKHSKIFCFTQYYNSATTINQRLCQIPETESSANDLENDESQNETASACFHDWVTGICKLCCRKYMSYQLRALYSKKTLEESTCLKCHYCIDAPGRTVLPGYSNVVFVKDRDNRMGELFLREPEAAHIWGDASFATVLGGPPAHLQKKYNDLCSNSEPFEISLLKEDVGTLRITQIIDAEAPMDI